MKNINDYIGTPTGIHCPTEAIFKSILNLLGLDKRRYNWIEYKEETCIELSAYEYCYNNWFKERNYIIYPASEFLEDREVIGYEWNELAKSNATKISSIVYGDPYANLLNMVIHKNSSAYNTMYRLGVLDIWTTKVYAEKPKEEHTLESLAKRVLALEQQRNK